MLGNALYFPSMDISNAGWLKSAALFWDKIYTIAPQRIENPFFLTESRLCAEAGILEPLRCDLHADVLKDVGDRILDFQTAPQSERVADAHPILDALASARGNMRDVSHEELKSLVGTYAVLPEQLQSLFESLGARHRRESDEALSHQMLVGALEAHVTTLSMAQLPFLDFWTGFFRSAGVLPMVSGKISDEYREAMMEDYRHAKDFVLTDARFVRIYMSLLAELLARKLSLSPLTDNAECAAVNLSPLFANFKDAHHARGALVSVVMENLRIDPVTPIEDLIDFRQKKSDQLAELAGKFETLKTTVQNAEDRREMELSARRVYENEIRPALNKLRSSLRDKAIGSAWDGVQTATTFSMAPSAAIWALGAPPVIALGAGAAIAIAGVAIKASRGHNEARSASPFTYLLDLEKKFAPL